MLTRPDPPKSGKIMTRPDPARPDPTRPDPRVHPTRGQLWPTHTGTTHSHTLNVCETDITHNTHKYEMYGVRARTGPQVEPLLPNY